MPPTHNRSLDGEDVESFDEERGGSSASTVVVPLRETRGVESSEDGASPNNPHASHTHGDSSEANVVSETELPSHHDESEQNYREDDRRQIFHPRPNDAGYAKLTDSFKHKMNDKLEYHPPSSPGFLVQRKGSLRNDSAPLVRSSSVSKVQKALRFQEPSTPSINPKNDHNRKRAQSLLSISLSRDNDSYTVEHGGESANEHGDEPTEDFIEGFTQESVEEPTEPVEAPTEELAEDTEEHIEDDRKRHTDRQTEKHTDEHYDDALYAICYDLSRLLEDFEKEKKLLTAREVLNSQEDIPLEVKLVRQNMIKLIECYDSRFDNLAIEYSQPQQRDQTGKPEGATTLTEKQGKSSPETEATRENHQQKVLELEEALRKTTEQNAYDQAKIDSQFKSIQELEKNVQAANDKIEQQARSIEEMEDALQENDQVNSKMYSQIDRIQKLEMNIQAANDTIEQQACQIEEMGESLQEKQSSNEAHMEKIEELEVILEGMEVNGTFAKGIGTPSGHPLFARQKKIADAREQEIDHLKTSVKKLDAYLPDLERENKDLKAYVANHRDTVNTLKDQLATSQSAAKEWHTEYKQQREMLGQRAFADARELADLRQEMQNTISKYQALMPSKDNPDALEIMGLVSRIGKQDKVLEEAKQRLDEMKKAKILLEAAIERTMHEKKALVKENENLRFGAAPPPRFLYDEETKEKLYLPAWNRDDLRTKRENAVAELRAKQKAARQAKEAEERLLGKIRESKMGKWYPPLRGNYKDLANKSAWDKWDGNEWMLQASQEDYDEAKKQGLLNDRSRMKNRRTQDWSGK